MNEEKIKLLKKVRDAYAVILKEDDGALEKVEINTVDHFVSFLDDQIGVLKKRNLDKVEVDELLGACFHTDWIISPKFNFFDDVDSLFRKNLKST